MDNMFNEFINLKNAGLTLANVYNTVRSGIPTAVFGVQFAEKGFIASSLDSPILYVVRDSLTALKVVDEIKAFNGEEVVYLPSKNDVLIYKQAFNRDNLFKRITALYKIQKGAKYVVTTFESLMQPLSKDISSLFIEKGKDYNFEGLVENLVFLGYKRKEFAESKGEFALRGDIFEIFPINSEKIFRIDFFGDEAESIKSYYLDDKENKKDEQSCLIICANDFVIYDYQVENIESKILASAKKFGKLLTGKKANEIAQELIEKVENNRQDYSLTYLLPLLEENCYNLLDSLLEDTVVILDEPKLLYENIENLIKEKEERCKELQNGGQAFDFTFKVLKDKEVILNSLQNKRLLSMQMLVTQNKFFSPLRTFKIDRAPLSKYSFNKETLYDDLKGWLFSGYTVITCCGSTQKVENTKENLFNRSISFRVSEKPNLYERGIVLTSMFIPNGFILHECKLVVLGTCDLFIGISTEKKIKKRRNDMFQAPEVGDFCVHEYHGIGKIIGVNRISTQDGVKDYVAIEYKGGDVLHVAVEQMDKLSKYVGEERPPLNKLGGAEFERIKEKVKKAIAEMTIDLKKLYKERAENKGFKFSKDNEYTEEFANSFEFDETEDQLISIDEIRKDMESDKVMDRLLCGDVGFGKTEVAFRATFKAIMDNKQVALVCPTTILSEQHYLNACKRFENFGVRIACLNRFRTASQTADILQKIKDGQVDLVIGTHKLFSKSVVFYDLGLLILDEEHRFGVEHKETLKVLKKNVDTLTMTATPIPRTLHMSLTGIRDISSINTPPQERIPVQTYVVEYSETLVKDAINKELARGGQVFILYNRVESIYSFASRIQEIVTDAKVLVAHGQMETKRLEESILSFYNHEFNVLVATTIIENGIDLPKANTLIVVDSDLLGLSTLYQLKGRVGRSNVMAYAYFTYDEQKVLSETAYKRLSALMEFTEMGSGYKIAMRDLEIRGAGNILGREQHGHMDRIGYELYSKLLKESMESDNKVAEDNTEAELDIRVDAYIPENYIGNSSSRMDCYKQIANIRSLDDEARIRKSLVENYGNIPKEIENLILIAKIKEKVKKFNVVKVNVNSLKGSFVLKDVASINNVELIKKMEEWKKFVTFSCLERPELVFDKNKLNNNEILNAMYQFIC